MSKSKFCMRDYAIWSRKMGQNLDSKVKANLTETFSNKCLKSHSLSSRKIIYWLKLKVFALT